MASRHAQSMQFTAVGQHFGQQLMANRKRAPSHSCALRPTSWMRSRAARANTEDTAIDDAD